MSHINVNCKYIRHWSNTAIYGGKHTAKTDFYGYVLYLASQQLSVYVSGSGLLLFNC